MGWEVIFAPRAENDVAKIVDYIANDDPAAAIRFGETLISKASLADAPEMGPDATRESCHPLSTRRQLSYHLSTR